MRAVIQRVSAARVRVGERLAGQIGRGLLVLLGIAIADTAVEADWLLDRLVHMRIFENETGKFDRSLLQVNGELLVVSQFTLLADTDKGRRPSFSGAARPEQAASIYGHFVERARTQGITTATGEFGAHMDVELINDGPVTVVLDSAGR